MDLKSKFDMTERLATKLEHRLKQVQELGMKSVDVDGIEELISLVTVGDRVGTIRQLKTLTGLSLKECKDVVVKYMPGRELHTHDLAIHRNGNGNGNGHKPSGPGAGNQGPMMALKSLTS